MNVRLERQKHELPLLNVPQVRFDTSADRNSKI